MRVLGCQSSEVITLGLGLEYTYISESSATLFGHEPAYHGYQLFAAV